MAVDPEHQNRTHRIANLHVAREHDAIQRRLNRRIAKLLFKLLQVGAILRKLPLRLPDLRLQNLQLRLGHILFVERHLVILLSVVERRSRHHTLFCHALRAFISAFQQRNIRPLGINSRAHQVGARPIQTGFGGFHLRASLVHARLNFILVELGQNLSLFYAVAIVDVQLLHNSAGLRLDLDLRDWLDLAGRHHALRQVSAFHLRQLRRINLGAAGGCDHYPGHYQSHERYRHRTPDNDSFCAASSPCRCRYRSRLPPAGIETVKLAFTSYYAAARTIVPWKLCLFSAEKVEVRVRGSLK